MRILKTQDFSHRIAEIIYHKGCGMIDAILIYCDENDVEPAQVRRLISDEMKQQLEVEARSHNLLKKAS